MSDIDELFTAAEEAPEGDLTVSSNNLNNSRATPSTSRKDTSLSKSKSVTKSSIKTKQTTKEPKRRRIIESDSESETDEQNSESGEGEDSTLNQLAVSGFDPTSFLDTLISNLEDKYKDDVSDQEEIDMVNLEVVKSNKDVSNGKKSQVKEKNLISKQSKMAKLSNNSKKSETTVNPKKARRTIIESSEDTDDEDYDNVPVKISKPTKVRQQIDNSKNGRNMPSSSKGAIDFSKRPQQKHPHQTQRPDGKLQKSRHQPELSQNDFDYEDDQYVGHEHYPPRPVAMNYSSYNPNEMPGPNYGYPPHSHYQDDGYNFDYSRQAPFPMDYNRPSKRPMNDYYEHLQYSGYPRPGKMATQRPMNDWGYDGYSNQYGPNYDRRELANIPPRFGQMPQSFNTQRSNYSQPNYPAESYSNSRHYNTSEYQPEMQNFSQVDQYLPNEPKMAVVNYQSKQPLLPPDLPISESFQPGTSVTVTRHEVMYKPSMERSMNSSTALALPMQPLKSVNKIFNRTKMEELNYQKSSLNDMLKQLFEEPENDMACFLIKLAQVELKNSKLPRSSKNMTPIIRFDYDQVPQFEFYLRAPSTRQFSIVELVKNVDDETINLSKMIYQFLEEKTPNCFAN